MKKKIFLLLTIAVFGMFSGCTNPDSKEDISDSQSDSREEIKTDVNADMDSSDEENFYQLSQINYDGIRNLNFCLYNDSIIYFNYGSKLTFGKYNLANDMIYLIGEVENASTYQSGKFTVCENNLYLYILEYIVSEQNEEKLVNSLYKIDMEEQTMEKIAECSESGFLPLYAVQDKIVSLKGKITSEERETYLDMYDLSKGRDADFSILLSKKYDIKSATGEVWKIRKDTDDVSAITFSEDFESIYGMVCGDDERLVISLDKVFYKNYE